MTFKDRLDEVQRDLEKRRRGFQDNLDELAAQEFTGQDEDGRVRVTVDGLGAVRAVRVDPAQLRKIMDDELGRSVVEAVRAARSASEEGAREVLKRRREPTRSGGPVRSGKTSRFG